MVVEPKTSQTGLFVLGRSNMQRLPAQCAGQFVEQLPLPRVERGWVDI